MVLCINCCAATTKLRWGLIGSMGADSDVCQETEGPDPYVFNLICKMSCHHASDGEATGRDTCKQIDFNICYIYTKTWQPEDIRCDTWLRVIVLQTSSPCWSLFRSDLFTIPFYLPLGVISRQRKLFCWLFFQMFLPCRWPPCYQAVGVSHSKTEAFSAAAGLMVWHTKESAKTVPAGIWLKSSTCLFAPLGWLYVQALNYDGLFETVPVQMWTHAPERNSVIWLF